MARSTIDEVGISTLENLSIVDKLNDWMFDSIRPYIKGRILEIGSGIGNISTVFVNHGIPICVSDYSDHYCNLLDRRFSNEPLIEGVFQIDLSDTDFEIRYGSLIGKFDTVFALNVIEHIKNDQLAISNCKKLLSPEGHLIILVPAWQSLYNTFDRELEHFRRYTIYTARKLFSSQQLEIINTWYFNLAGILGWFVFGTVLRNKTLPSSQLSLYNKLVPIFRLVDKITLNKVGLSVIIVGKKSEK